MALVFHGKLFDGATILLHKADGGFTVSIQSELLSVISDRHPDGLTALQATVLHYDRLKKQQQLKPEAE
jgi:hypothetical protein